MRMRLTKYILAVFAMFAQPWMRYVRTTMDELSEQDSRIVRALATSATNYAMAAELLAN